MFPHPAATNSTSRFMPSNNQSFAPRPGLSPAQPSSPTQVQAQPAPPAPPPTVQTADTTKVSGMSNADAKAKGFHLFAVTLSCLPCSILVPRIFFS
jgi:hypothetical protein